MEYKINSNLIKNIKNRQRILNLQQDFESGIILEKDLNNEDKQKLLELYNEQIQTLNYNINTYNKILNNYKQKIIAIRKNI